MPLLQIPDGTQKKGLRQRPLSEKVFWKAQAALLNHFGKKKKDDLPPSPRKIIHRGKSLWRAGQGPGSAVGWGKEVTLPGHQRVQREEGTSQVLPLSQVQGLDSQKGPGTKSPQTAPTQVALLSKLVNLAIGFSKAMFGPFFASGDLL